MPINKTNRVEPPPPLDPPEVRRLSDIAICPTLWLWPGRVALGQLTLVAGEPGAGTSLLLMDLASRVSRGTPFPDANAGADGKNARSEASKGDTAAAAPADVLLILRRDQEQLAIPRLALMGADGSRIEVMGDVPDREMGKQEGSIMRPFRAWSDLAHVESWLARTPEAKLVVIDPLDLSLDGRGSSFPYEDRQMLRKLDELARKYGVAIVAAARVPEKPGAADLRRCLDKLAGVGEIGAVFAVVRDRRRPSRRYLLAVKNRQGETENGLAFETPGGRIAWGRDGVSSAVLYATAGQLDQLDAALWLRGELAEGARAAKELGTMANEAGIPWHVVYRAKAIAGAVGYRKGFGPGSRVFWRLEDVKTAAEENEASGLPEPKEPDFTIENENSGFSHGADRDTFSDPAAPAEMATDLGSEGRNSGFKADGESDASPSDRRNPRIEERNSEAEPIRMPWGKHEGAPVENLDHHYLKEVLSWDRKRLDDDLLREIDRVLRQQP